LTTYRTPLSQDYDWQLSVADRVASPAGGEAKGTRYLITVGSGDFTGYSNYIATAKQANPSAPAHWYFDAPLEGMAVYVKDEDKVYQYITSWNELRISCLFDVDRDTGIEVEQSADEDKIRFKTGGTERAIIDNVGKVGIGISAPTTLLHVSVANTKNQQALLVEQLDTTNNPICAEINNDGTNYGLIIRQDGVLATDVCGVIIYSNAAQVNNSRLLLVQQDNASSTKEAVWILNDGTGQGLIITQAGNGIAQEINNDGTNHGLYIHQDGAVGAPDYKNALFVYSNAICGSTLVSFESANASSTGAVMAINNYGTGNGIVAQQPGILNNEKHGLFIQSNAIQVNSSLIYFLQDNASATADVLEIDNDGTGRGLYIHQDGVLASGKFGLYVYSNAAQVNSTLTFFWQYNASSTGATLIVQNEGTGHGIVAAQFGVLAASKYGLYVYSNSIQVNAPLVYFLQDNASSTKGVLLIQNDGSGPDIEKSPGDLIFKDANAGTLTLTDLATASIEFVIDGGDDTITTGIKGDLEIPFDCTIQRVTLLADQTGDIVVDIWMDTYANYPPTDADSITSEAPPTIAAGVKSQDSTLTGWTKTIAAGKTLRFNVDSITAIRRCAVSLKVIKT
jgi:hypothetical protein